MKIAIVGGIGSGKSEVLKVARDMGLACLSADEINSDLLKTPEYIAEIAKAFPTAVCGGRIDRATLSKIVFSDDSARGKLNEIAHPRILARIRDENASPLIVEMPLLLECGAQSLFDEIVFVYTPMKLRIERLEKRGLSKENAKLRMAAQVSEQELRAVATCTVDNSGDIAALRKSAGTALRELLHRAE